MRCKVYFFILFVLLLNSAFVDSQSIKGLLVPQTNRTSNTVLPQAKSIQQVESFNDETIGYTTSASLPKGSFVPRLGQNNSLVPRNMFKKTTVSNNKTLFVQNKVQQYSQQQANYQLQQSVNNKLITQQPTATQQPNTDLLNEVPSQSTESVDMTGFSKIPTLESTPVRDIAAEITVDTARLIAIKNNPSLVTQPKSSVFSYGVDTNHLMNKVNTANTNNGIFAQGISNETVDTAHLISANKKATPYISNHVGAFSETVDTAAFLAKMKPAFHQELPSDIIIKPKPIYKSQTFVGTMVAEKGKSSMFRPLEIDTSTLFAPVPAPVVNVPLAEVVPEIPKGIGQLGDLLPTDTVPVIPTANILGELGELSGEASNIKKDNPTTPKLDDFYRFQDGTVYYDTTKVITNTRGKSFSGSLTSKPGKSSVLQPSVNQNDPASHTNRSNLNTTNNNNNNTNKSGPLQGVLVAPADPVASTSNQSNTDPLNINFNIYRNGSLDVVFSCNVFYMSIGQYGQINNYAFSKRDKKNESNNTIHKNILGLVDNIAGFPIEYNEEHLVSKVGSWPITYTFDNMISKVGEHKVYYTSVSGVKKIDKFKVNYDIGRTVLSIDDSGGLIIFKTEDIKK